MMPDVKSLDWQRVAHAAARHAWAALANLDAAVPVAAAGAVLAAIEAGEVAPGQGETAERVLVAALRRRLPALLSALAWPDPVDSEAALASTATPAGPCLRVDAAFIGHLALLSVDSEKLLAKASARFAARERQPGKLYALFQARDGAPRFLRLFAKAVLSAEFAGCFKAANTSRVPGVAYAVLRAFQRLGGGGRVVRPPRNRSELRLMHPSGVVVGVFRLRPGSDPAVVEEGILHLAESIEGERLWRFLVRAGVATADGEAVVVEGGAEGLRVAAGITSKRRTSWLVPMLEALRCFRGEDGTLPEAVHSQRVVPATRGRRAVIEIEVGDTLRPGFASRLPRDQRRWRRLLPVLEAPPIVGVSREFSAAVFALQWEVLLELHRQARMGERAPVLRLTDAFLARTARRTGLGLDAVRQALAGQPWLTPGRDGLVLVDAAAMVLLTDTARLYGRQARGGRNLARLKRGARRPAESR